MSKAIHLIIGIPTWCEETNIKRLTELIDASIPPYLLPHTILANADNSSPDNTRRQFMAARTKARKVSLVTLAKGKGYNFRKLFEYFLKTQADYLITFDADLVKVEQTWVECLYNETRNGFDMIVPVYFRAWFDGNMTNQIVVPIIFAVTGLAIRQPIAGEFAFSRKLIEKLVSFKWATPVMGYGIDIFCLLSAIGYGFKVSQLYLPGGKFHNQRSFDVVQLEEEFDSKFEAVIGTLFLMLSNMKSNDGKFNEFPRAPHCHYLMKREFDGAYIQNGASMAFSRLKHRTYATDIYLDSPAITDDIWCRLLKFYFQKVKTEQAVDPSALNELRYLFYMRLATCLPTLNDSNVEERVVNLSRRLRQMLK